MKKYEFTGKKLDATIEEALKTLNKKQEEVDINIISEGGLFKKCKIEVVVEEEKEEKIEKTETVAEKEQPQESKIYLVKQTSNTPQPKPKTKRRRSPKIAFEGLVLKPEKVSLSQEESPPSQEPKQRKISF